MDIALIWVFSALISCAIILKTSDSTTITSEDGVTCFVLTILGPLGLAFLVAMGIFIGVAYALLYLAEFFENHEIRNPFQ